jgi:small GTP-binding protein
MVETNRLRKFTFKIIFLGEAAVGKTSIIARHVSSSFDPNCMPSLGANVTTKDYILGDQSITLLIWDIAAQEAYSRVRQQYYNGARALFLVYDVTRRETFERVLFWFDDFKQIVQKKVPIVLVCNKVDLPAVVDRRLGEGLAHEIGADFVETSAKTGQNVEQIFERVVRLLSSETSD